MLPAKSLVVTQNALFLREAHTPWDKFLQRSGSPVSLPKSGIAVRFGQLSKYPFFFFFLKKKKKKKKHYSESDMS